ncbi:copper chaperone [Solimonas aquatica]|uniref:Copper chaperone n=1 Tax=Solimonas aquatica TaxID=489703 RepID=A0A1H9DX42_9GAMM|nr:MULTISPECIES: heavy-metal-associated domain-containing protein [Solimonas]SEQ18025.1 copper chaperone [Solimonas aquatica]
MYEFEVKDMNCNHCVQSVTRAIQSQDPGAKVSIDLATKRVKVESQADETAIRRALADADYPAT